MVQGIVQMQLQPFSEQPGIRAAAAELLTCIGAEAAEAGVGAGVMVEALPMIQSARPVRRYLKTAMCLPHMLGGQVDSYTLGGCISVCAVRVQRALI